MLTALLAPPLCWSCRAPPARGGALCPACRGRLHFLGPEPVALSGVRVWAPVAYDGPARDLVKALKFHAATGVAGPMAALVAANAPAGFLAGTLVPVPLHPARQRARAFNQAAVIAGAISERCGLAVSDCLRRSGPDRRQVGRGRGARLAGPVGAIEPGAPAAPGRVLLVDDVVTTGATLAACVAAARAAGATRVEAVAFARTPGR
ncbi:MAG: hypothetical protein QOH58_3376 [Thermoleophilaceae bacterium]|jgi:predicted amidophosphoribosyltransferase|nr:hypothetical protein [Thermoleophilaceae bacterium]